MADTSTGVALSKREQDALAAERAKEHELRTKIDALKKEITAAEGNVLLENALRRGLKQLEQAKELQRRFKATRGPIGEPIGQTDQTSRIETPTAKTVSLSRDAAIVDVQRRAHQLGKKIWSFAMQERRKRLGIPEPVNPLLADAQRRADKAAEAEAGRR
jgi:hypothetical protein